MVLPQKLKKPYSNLHNKIRYMNSQQLMKQQFKKFPNYVNIATTAFCTTSCTMCPYGKEETKDTPKGIMSEELFRKIVDECSQHQNEIERISPFLDNDPFTDRKFIERLKYIKSVCPKPVIVLSTNASLMTTQITDELIDLVDSLTFTVAGGVERTMYEKHQPNHNYDQIMKNIDYLLDKVDNNLYRLKKRHITINTFYTADPKIEREHWGKRGVKFEFLTPIVSRAGLVFPVSAISKKIMKGCSYGDIPLHEINIQYNGGIQICCMDWQRKNIISNVREHTIQEAWNCEEFNKIREMAYGKIPIEPWLLCNNCEKAI